MAKNGIQVIAPSRKGESGTESLNILLQQTLNPSSKYKREHRFRDRIFREGDRVMQTRNNYDIQWNRSADDKDGNGIFNGDIGIVEVPVRVYDADIKVLKEFTDFILDLCKFNMFKNLDLCKIPDIYTMQIMMNLYL